METTEFNGRILDWKPSTHAEQNQQFRLKGLDCYSTGERLTRIKRTMPLNLDQGREGACTGFGCAHTLASTPRKQTDVDAKLAQAIYHQARREDEWEGEDYDGSSVNGAMHAARTLGRIKAWRWIKQPVELQHALSFHGSAEAGSVWLSGMFNTDADGYLRLEGREIGGHAYCISGYRPSPTRQHFVDYWIDNSWGPDWGVDGGGWIRDIDAYQLWFTNHGEIAIPIK